MSPQKSCKLKTVQTIFWSIRQVLIEVWCNFKYYFLSVTLRPTLCFSSSIFRYHCDFFFASATLSHFSIKVRTVAVQKRNISSASNFFIQPLLTRIHFFRYVNIRIRSFRIVIRPNRNNYYNITNVPTTFYLS